MAPKRALKSSKGFRKVNSKMEPILITFWTTFEPILESILELKSDPKRDQKLDHFWNRYTPHLWGSGVAFSEIIREGGKRPLGWKYTLHKKGRDILELKSNPERNQKGDHFWNHDPPHLRGGWVAKPWIRREECRSLWSWKYTLQKKGRDFNKSNKVL